MTSCTSPRAAAPDFPCLVPVQAAGRYLLCAHDCTAYATAGLLAGEGGELLLKCMLTAIQV